MLTPKRLLGALIRRRALIQQTLVFRGARRSPLTETVLFQAFEGKTVGDSPLAIMLELSTRKTGLELFYVVSSEAQRDPENCQKLVYGSAKWVRALATAKYIVSNNNLPEFFEKREGQCYLQTWHGTPLKRLGRDTTNAAASSHYISSMNREAASWDYLVSPSPYCTEILPRALGFEGQILESGYPRNDALTGEKSKRDAIRSLLGVSAAEKLVLYAPTWRDSKRTLTGAWAGVNFFEAKLPSGFRMMFRGHNNTHSAHKSDLAGEAIDVTTYPNINDLYLAADVLVTDYSSVMFDFSITGKPMAFLAPDLDDYKKNRGFYFDFEADAPGPIFVSSADLVKALPTLSTDEPKYSAWRKKFNPLEDGFAAKRVVDAVWGSK